MAKELNPTKPEAMPFSRKNYLWMIIGIVCILIGFLVMSMDKEPFGFGFLGLTLGPVIVVAGFIVEFYAILQKK
ncbi:MAG: DUF3098 domain-containing protein [Siphonobacter sp.]